MSQLYDLVIIGAGPAGLTAGIYASRAGLKTLLLEKAFAGGQMVSTFQIENYSGFPEGIGGTELTALMQAQVEKLGLSLTTLEVKEIIPQADGSLLLKHSQGTLITRSLIIASGAQPRLLGVPGEERLRGRGVSFCATCDGAFFRDESLVVVGGGNSALDEAIFLTRFASQVTIVHRRNKLRAEKFLQEKAFQNPKIKFIWDSVVTEVGGENKVEYVRLKNVKNGQSSQIPVGGVFMYIGLTPNTGFLGGLVPLDKQGFIPTGEDMATQIPGVFAAGDVRSKEVRQIATAVGDGAIAAIMAEKYLEASG